MTVRKLKEKPFAQAQVIEYDDGSKELISYKSRVVAISPDGFMTVFALCTATTRKHIGAFMRELGLDYATARDLYFLSRNSKRWQAMNIHTGELIDIDVDWRDLNEDF